MRPRDVQGVLVDVRRRYRDEQITGWGEIPIQSFACEDTRMRRPHNGSETPHRNQAVGVG
jgi:hypothetical protein